MGLFRRGGELERLARELAAANGERSLGVATATDGTLLVATDRALYVGDLRLPWDRVARATWDSDDGALTVVASTGADEPARRLDLRVDEATRLLEVVRTMVTSNLVVSQRIEDSRFGGAWVTARRDPDADELRWTVAFDPGLDPADPALRAWADANVLELRRSTGV